MSPCTSVVFSLCVCTDRCQDKVYRTIMPGHGEQNELDILYLVYRNSDTSIYRNLRYDIEHSVAISILRGACWYSILHGVFLWVHAQRVYGHAHGTSMHMYTVHAPRHTTTRYPRVWYMLSEGVTRVFRIPEMYVDTSLSCTVPFPVYTTGFSTYSSSSDKHPLPHGYHVECDTKPGYRHPGWHALHPVLT